MGDDTKSRELKQAKLNLYRLLLEKSPDSYNEQEIEIAFNLSRDPEMVALREEAWTKNRAAEDAAIKAAKVEDKPAEGSPIA